LRKTIGVFRLARRSLFVAIALISSGAAAGQSPRAEFEAASIKINRDRSERPTLMRPILQKSGRVLMTNQPLRDVIRAAYGINESQIVGGPSWIGMTGFDVDARGAAGMSIETARTMLQALLADRFSLAVHREQRQQPVYELTVAARNGRPGPQLRAAKGECLPVTRPAGMPPLPPPPPPGLTEAIPLLFARTAFKCPSIFMAGYVSARAVSLDALSTELEPVVGRPVLNRTGLTGEFDIDLSYSPGLEAATAGTDLAPQLATALRDQLGLRLAARRRAVDVLVIDRATMPSEN